MDITMQNQDQSQNKSEVRGPQLTSPSWEMNSSHWVSKDCYYHHHIFLHENKIIAINKFAYVFGAFALSGKFKLTVKIEQMQLFIGVGVSDVGNVSKSSLQNYILRYNCTGECYENGVFTKDAQQFKAGDKICLTGASDGKINFYKNESLAITLEVNDKSMELVPFLCLSCGDCVSIVDSFCNIQVLSVFLAQSWFMWDSDILCQLDKLIDLTERQWQN